MASNIANMLEAAKEGIKKLYNSRPTFNVVCNTIAGVTAVAAITGTTTSSVVDYSTDAALGFCCAGALLAQDGAVARKLVLFLLWEVYRAVQWYKHRQSSSVTVLSKDLNPVLRNVLIILVLGVVLAVLVLFRPQQQPSAEAPDADLEAQRAAVADEEADTEQARTASQAVNSAAQALDDYAGPSTMMNLSPIHRKPDNNPLPPALPMPVVTPAPRPRTTRQLYRGRPFGFTMDLASIVPA